MSGHFLIQHLLLFFLLNADITHTAKCTTSNPHWIVLVFKLKFIFLLILTLSVYSRLTVLVQEISLFFLQGNHILSKELLLTHGHNFSLTISMQNETVLVAKVCWSVGKVWYQWCFIYMNKGPTFYWLLYHSHFQNYKTKQFQQ